MSRRPDFLVFALNKETSAKGEVGAAWNNPGGSITIKFNPFIDGKALNLHAVIVTLFPNEPPTKIGPQLPPRERFEDDGIPF